MAEQQVLLTVNHLKKYYPVKGGWFGRVTDYVKAVDDVSFQIRRGETLGLVGESGCGKTTTARVILQLQRPTAGEVILNGNDLCQMQDDQLRSLRTQMQIIFQNPYTSLNPRMTIGAAIAEPIIVHGIAHGNAAHERVAELLTMVGLNRYFAGRFPSEFSGGQRQRIGIARALSVNPGFVICDEPISSLDVSIQAQIVNLLKRLQDQLGLTYLFISHDLRMVRYISNRIAVMYLGKIVEMGQSLDIWKKPLHPYTQALWAALPLPDPELEEKRQRIVLQGNVPSPINPPQGCRFNTRCPRVLDICREVEPPLRELEPDHQVACHLYDWPQ
ncbi:MAG: peptide ABC transporter substrate-binding protein [Chloroflexi bacterium HGW-Chloroflexi-1]|nr:MAG: peptide ABC transporter substrate-binding protein [Chloroflexi bacterium HGW-Chloroflexi-1]